VSRQETNGGNSIGLWLINSRDLINEYSAREEFLKSFVGEKLFEVLKPVIEDKVVRILAEAIDRLISVMKELVEVYFPVFGNELRDVLRGRVKVIGGEFEDPSKTLLPETDWHSLKIVIDAIDRELKNLNMDPSEHYKRLRHEIKFVDLDFYKGIKLEEFKKFLIMLGTRDTSGNMDEFKKKIAEGLSFEIARIWLAKEGCQTPSAQATMGWDMVAFKTSTSEVAWVEVKGSTEDVKKPIELRCDIQGFESECINGCNKNRRCLIIVVEKVAKDPCLRVIHTCDLDKEFLKSIIVELPEESLKYGKAFWKLSCYEASI